MSLIPTVDFSSAKVRPKIRSTRLTEGLMVTGEVTGMHLHQAFGQDDLANINIGYAQIFSSTDKYHGKPLVGMTEAKGKVLKINSHGFRWQLSGGTAQKARITQVINIDTYPGINNTRFDIVVDKPWFNVSDIIQPQDNRYQVRVMHSTDGSRSYRRLGPNKFQYSCQIVTNDASAFVPRRFLEMQAEWCKVSSAVANEANIDAGGFQFYSIFESEGQVQQHAVKVELTDKAARKALSWKNGKLDKSQLDGTAQKAMQAMWTQVGENKTTGKPIYSFISLLETEAFNELYRNVEHTLMFGTESSIMYSPEGYQIYTASGLREQLQSGWVLEHNGNLSLQEMEDWFDMILKDKISEGDQKIVLSAGREFRKMFDRMIKADSSSFLTLDTHFIRKGDDYRHMDYGSYFASYKGFTVDIMVMENPAYDNQYFSPNMHPVKVNTPIDSWRADILDFGYAKEQGTQGTTPNISMVCEDYCDYHIRYAGKYYAHDGKTGLPILDGGYGQAGGVSGFSILEEKSAGLMIADVTRCGSIYLCIDEQDYSNAPASAEDYWIW